MSANAPRMGRVWDAAGGGPARAGVFAGHAVVHGRPIRRLVARGAVLNSVVFDGEGAVFIADMAGGVQACAPEGALRWEARVEAGVQASPALSADGGTLFVGTLGGRVYALNSKSGRSVWQRELPTRSDPRILSDLLHEPATGAVIVSSWGGRWHALDAGTGKTRFEIDAGISPAAAAAADPDGNLYLLRAVAKGGTELVRVAPAGTETVLHRQAETARGARRALVAAAPVLDLARQTGHAVCNRDRGAELVTWSLTSGQVKQRAPLPRAVQGTPALLPDGSVALADFGGRILAVEPGGAIKFEYVSDTEYLLAGPVAEAGGWLYCGDPLGQLHAVDEKGRGRCLFEAERSVQGRCSFAPDGALYVPSADRVVYVFAAGGLGSVVSGG